MGFLNGLKLVQSLKFGKQLGNVSKNGLACYAKSGRKGTTTYTTVNALNGDIVRAKRIIKQGNTHSIATVWDNKGNVTAFYETIKTPLANFGHASHNQFAFETRNMSQRYNKFGQVTDSRDVTFKPSTRELGVNINYHVNEKATTRYLFTDTNKLSPEYSGHVNFLIEG